jgi:hypothetical protein
VEKNTCHENIHGTREKHVPLRTWKKLAFGDRIVTPIKLTSANLVESLAINSFRSTWD